MEVSGGGWDDDEPSDGISSDEPPSQRQRHENLLGETTKMVSFPSEAQAVVDHAILLRAKEKYLFDGHTNQSIVADDPWLRDVWAWVAGKE
jgi:hypothetical protein